MIARAFIYLVVVAVLADAYLHVRFLRRLRWWWQLLWWLPSLLLIGWACWLRREPDFVPSDMTPLQTFLLSYMVTVIPKALFALCDVAGLALGHWWKRGRMAGLTAGAIAAVATVVAICYSYFVGFYRFEVTRVELAFNDLPKNFDGYRIVLWSDAHVGTLTGERQSLLARAIDSINAQKADMVVFTGDLQNARPQEIEPHKELLSSIKARDGVFSVMGNHDYPVYSGADEFQKYADLGTRCSIDEELGWTQLNNGHRTIRRGDEHIIIAGMENDGEGKSDRDPQLGDIQIALWGVSRDEFVVMLEHDPRSWRRNILPHSHTQLTLSGHTHAMQLSLFGWSPVSLVYKEAWGLYRIGQRALYVTKGLGGVIPFRLGASGEIVVITLKNNQ